MSSVRVSVEWLFGDIVRSFKFLDFKNNFKCHRENVCGLCIDKECFNMFIRKSNIRLFRSWPEILDSQRSARGLVTISSFARGHENIKVIDSNYTLMRHGEWLERKWKYAWFLPSNYGSRAGTVRNILKISIKVLKPKILYSNPKIYF